MVGVWVSCRYRGAHGDVRACQSFGWNQIDLIFLLYHRDRSSSTKTSTRRSKRARLNCKWHAIFINGGPLGTNKCCPSKTTTGVGDLSCFANHQTWDAAATDRLHAVFSL